MILQALVGADNRSLQTMATEQLVELFALDDGLSGTTLDTGSLKKSLESNTPSTSDKYFTSSDFGANFNIEELWELSQVFFSKRELDSQFHLNPRFIEF